MFGGERDLLSPNSHISANLSHQAAAFIVTGLLFPSVNISSAPRRHTHHFAAAEQAAARKESE